MPIKKNRKPVVSKKFRDERNLEKKHPKLVTPAMKKRMFFDPDGHWAIINKVLRPQKNKGE